MRQLTCGSLFAGIGGFDLGFERAGIKTIWQVEIDEYCRRVLAKHFPDAERFNDVREVGKHNLKPVDIICGGFPCQDISQAGEQAGIDGGRSGLWKEMFRVICELRPRIIVVENVAALLNGGIGRVLRDLAGAGFDAEWRVLSACQFGAPHTRERVFIMAYPTQERWMQASVGSKQQEKRHLASAHEGLLDKPNVSNKAHVQVRRVNWGNCPPRTMGMVDGFPDGLHEIGALGNAIVPQIAEWIGKRIVEVSSTEER